MRLTLPLLSVFLTGCTIDRPVIILSSPDPVVSIASPTQLVETRYEFATYQDGMPPHLRHEAHAVYRRTRVPANIGGNLASVPLDEYAPISVAALPASEELTAELKTQRAITSDMRLMQASMGETKHHMEDQYAQLIRQTGEAAQLLTRMERDTRAQAQVAAPTPMVSPAAETEIKW